MLFCKYIYLPVTVFHLNIIFKVDFLRVRGIQDPDPIPRIFKNGNTAIPSYIFYYNRNTNLQYNLTFTLPWDIGNQKQFTNQHFQSYIIKRQAQIEDY